MITKDNIHNLHTKYNGLGPNADVCTDRNLNALMLHAIDSQHMDLDGEHLVLNKGFDPLHKIEIERIVGAEDLGSHMAIVLPASVVLVSKRTGDVNVYLPEC